MHGQAGELFVRGNLGNLASSRHYKNPQEFVKPSSRLLLESRTFIDRTGEIVVIDQSRDIFVTDRIKEMIKVKGFHVDQAELEGHLLDHPHIADAAVIGIPDEHASELPRAYVVLHPEQTSLAKRSRDAGREFRRQILKHVSDTKPSYMWLEGGIRFVDSIPKSASGKILRQVLKDAAAVELATAKPKL